MKLTDDNKINNSNEIVILKLGGGLLTDKNVPFSLREDILDSAVTQVTGSGKKIILIHGGGSFGHPVAREYSIKEGINSSIDKQIYGLVRTHSEMNRFNTCLINKFLERGHPALSLQASSMFIKSSGSFSIKSMDIIEASLALGIMPVLYGDIIIEKESFSIISGDRIVLELCRNINNYKVSKVIFAIEEDGLFVKGKEEKKSILADTIDPHELDSIELHSMEQKIDVTGGMKGKLDLIKEICRLNITVQILNGLKENNIQKALDNQDVLSTKIKASALNKSGKIIKRKMDHLRIPLEYDVRHSDNYFRHIKLIHQSLPEIDFDQIDLSCVFFNKKVSAPICIAAITGGNEIPGELNRILASAAESENIIMGVGSQRIGIEEPGTSASFEIVRSSAPNIPVIGNIGIGQICEPGFTHIEFNKCIEMLGADAIAIHFNALQELMQKNGNIRYKDFKSKFGDIRNRVKIPIIAKEVGTGLNTEIVRVLDKLGFDGFDVGGAGGTSFAAIETIRKNSSGENMFREPTEIFREWGIPTPVCILNTRQSSKKPIIATGGLRNGMDIAKAIVLGADIGGFAYNFLLSAWKDYRENTISNTINEIRSLKKELRSCMWLMNTGNIRELKGNIEKRVILGDLYRWIKQ